MNLKQLFLASLLLTGATSLLAQKGYLRGKIIDDEIGEALIGATIVLESDPSVGTTADFNGDYSLSLTPGTYSVVVSYVSLEFYLH